MSTPPAKTDDTTPYWTSSASLPTFAKLARDQRVDVVVVGGGITGLTTAYLLAAAGRQVAVLERGRCAQVDTGHTSAHLTMVTDARLSDLVDRIGRTHAQAVWDAGLAAISRVDTLVRELDIDCGFEWVDGYLHAPDGADDRQLAALREDAALAADLGFDATYLDDVPHVGRPGIRFENQARFHPRRYLAGLAKAIEDNGGHIYEHSEAEEFGTEVMTVMANGHTLTCDDIVIATHNPVVGISSTARATLFQTKLALYTSYVVAGRVAKGVVPDAMWWDTDTPYQYLRVDPHRDHDVVIFGGQDHKTGQISDTDACYAKVEQALLARVPEVAITHRWSGQVIETPDGLPFIGATADHQYAATGFAGNGMTFGTLGAMVVVDAILGSHNPWADLFAMDRSAIRRGWWDYLTENADYPYYLMRSRFAGAEGRSLRAVKRGQGKIIERNGQKLAVFRDAKGATTQRSAVCPHMGCVVAWNSAERTWDCPCHGSRFKPDGTVISGPAESPLADIGS